MYVIFSCCGLSEPTAGIKLLCEFSIYQDSFANYSNVAGFGVVSSLKFKSRPEGIAKVQNDCTVNAAVTAKVEKAKITVQNKKKTKN